MKKIKTFILSLVAVTVFTTSVTAQEESSSPFDAGLDIYSSYIWRGAKFGSGPAFQPWVSAGFGGLEIGAWGSVNASTEEAFEMDLYISYGFDFGLSVGFTDYYFGAVDGDSIGADADGLAMYEQLGWTKSDAHYLEPMIGYEIGGFSIMGAYGFAPDAAGDGDTYVEAGYSFDAVSIAVGIGDGVYTDDGEFNICNITLSTSKEIEITEKFTLPLSGAVTLNPSTGGFFIAVGVSL